VLHRFSYFLNLARYCLLTEATIVDMAVGFLESFATRRDALATRAILQFEQEAFM
jgi:hypothetical protein